MRYEVLATFPLLARRFTVEARDPAHAEAVVREYAGWVYGEPERIEVCRPAPVGGWVATSERRGA